MRVVKFLEMIDVEDQQAEGFALIVKLVDILCERFVKGSPIRQIRQRVG